MDRILQYTVPLFYIILFSVALSRLNWIQKAGFGQKFIIGFFIAKCIAGFAYNWIALHFIPYIGDLLLYFGDGQSMYQRFLASPGQFFQIYFQHIDYTHVDVTSSNSSFIQSAFELIKLFQGILCLFTGANLAANTVIFNFAAVLCFLYFWRFIQQQFPDNGLSSGFIFFVLPSMFFYSAGITKEGVVISILCLLILISNRLITKRFSLKRTMVWLITFAALFAIKFYVAALWIACLLLWRLLLFFKNRQWTTVITFTLIVVALFFSTNLLSSAANLVAYMVKRQTEFIALPASSAIYIVPLNTNPASFATALPTALNNVLFKPLPGEGGKTLFLVYFIEMVLFWVGMGWIFLKRQTVTRTSNQKAVSIILLIFAFYNLVFTGLIVPNLGAMVRYRSIFMPFLLLSALLAFSPTFFSGKWNSFFRKMIAN